MTLLFIKTSGNKLPRASSCARDTLWSNLLRMCHPLEHSHLHDIDLWRRAGVKGNKIMRKYKFSLDSSVFDASAWVAEPLRTGPAPRCDRICRKLAPHLLYGLILYSFLKHRWWWCYFGLSLLQRLHTAALKGDLNCREERALETKSERSCNKFEILLLKCFRGKPPSGSEPPVSTLW